MKLKKILLISLILLFVLSLGFATLSAADSDDFNNTSDFNLNDNFNINNDLNDNSNLDDNSNSVDNLNYNSNLNNNLDDNSNSVDNLDDNSNSIDNLDDNSIFNDKAKSELSLKDDSNSLYVSIDGNDENDGTTRETAVATIAKAISLSADGYTIYISSGTYEQNSSTQLSHALSFIGEDGTIIKRTGTSNAFTYTKDTIKTIAFKNIVFSSSTPNPSNPILSMAGKANLLLDNCTVTDAIAGRNGLIRYMGDSTGKVTNTKFIGLTGSTNSGSSYLLALGNANVKVDNCTFANIDESSFLCAVVYVNNNLANLTLTNSVFMNITGNLNAVVDNRGYMQIRNCRFTDISLSGNGPRGIVWGPETLTTGSMTYINSSVFYNNSIETSVAVNSSVVQCKAPTVIEFTSFIDNDVDFIVNNDNETNITANFNWWGTNQNPKNCSINGASSSGSGEEDYISLVSGGVTIDNWAIMTIDFETDNLIANEEYPIVININQYMYEDGEIDSSIDYGIDGALIKLDSEIGQLDASSIIYDEGMNHAKVYTKNGTVSVLYKALEEGSDLLSIQSGYEQYIYNLEFGKAISYIDIYVSKSGSDSNDGLSNETPVLTIGQALYIGKMLNGNLRIHIGEGRYVESGLVLNGTVVDYYASETKRTVYSFIGYGSVIIDGNGGNSSIFSIRNNSASFNNIRFTNVNGASVGGALNVAFNDNYYNRNTILSDLTINKCIFDNLNVKSNGGAIFYNYGSGKIVINNTKFYNLTTNSSQGGAIYVQEAGELARIKVTNSDFRDNFANNAGAMYLRLSNATILNSNFINNSAKYYPGAIYFYNASAEIENCIIANSSAKKQSAAIQIEEGSSDVGNLISIKSCIIENNTASDEVAPAIYVYRGAVNISYSSLVNDLSLATRSYKSKYDEYQGVATANNNWWGVNNPFGDNPIGGPYLSTLGGVFNGSNITVDRWVIMNIVLNDSSVLRVGNKVNISMDFNHVNTTDGEIELLSAGKMPREFTIRINATGGQAYPNYIRTINGEANSIFTAMDDQGLGDNFTSCALDIKSDNEINHIEFEINNYKGVIFLSVDGDDDKNGSQDSPVRTFARALELALDEELGSHEIFVLPGRYEVYGVELDYTYLLITGSGKDKTVFDGLSYTGGIFSIFESDLTVKNLTIVNGVNTYSSGGAFTNMGNLTLDHVNVTNCQVKNTNGGVIYSVGNLNLINSSFIENHALSGDSASGGVIYTDGYYTSLSFPPSINITDCEFISNSAGSSTFGGGVIYGQYLDGYKSIRNTRFINNKAMYGGAIFIQNSEGDFIMDNVTFIGNRATGSSSGSPYYGGGAINLIGKTDGRVGNVTITNSLFINNTARNTRGGGAILDRNVDLNISNSVILNNTDNVKNVQVYKDTTVYFPSGGRISVEDNWWGVNDLDDLNMIPANLSINRWVVMDLTGEIVDGSDSNLDDDSNLDEDSNLLGISNLNKNLNNYLVKTSLTKYNDGTLIPTQDNYYPFERLYLFETSNGQLNSSEGSLENNIATAILSSNERENIIKATIDGQTLELNTLDLYIKTILNIDFNSPISADEDLTISINLTDIDNNPINGTVILNISFKQDYNIEEINVTEGQKSIVINDLKIGNYTILANYYGEKQYLESNASKDIEINPATSNLQLDSYDISMTVGFGNLTGNLSNDKGPISNRTVSLIIDDDNSLNGLTDENGQFIIDLAELKVGNYTDLEIRFDGDMVYQASSSLVNLTVNKIILDLNAVFDGNIIASLAYADLDLPLELLEGLEIDALVQGINVNFISNYSAISNASAIAIIPLDGLNPANYTAEISLADNDYYVLSSNKEINFGIDKYDTVLKAVLDLDSKSIIINLTSDGIGISKLVTVLIGEDGFNVTTDANGSYIVDISNLIPGLYDCSFAFAGDDCYNEAHDNLSFAIDKFDTNIDANDTEWDIGSANITACLTSDGNALKDKTLSLSINNGTLTGTTDENGIFIFDLSDLPAGIYDGEISFAGDDLYKNSSVSIAIVINKLNMTLEKEFADKKLNLTLKYGDNPIEGKDISIEIVNLDSNISIPFDAKTDSNGNAMVDLSSLDAGNYTGKIMIAEDERFNSISDEYNFTIEDESKQTRTAKDLQELIDNATEGSTIDLGEYTYVNVSNINITKDISLIGNNTCIISAGDGNPIFNIASDLDNVSISGIDFSLSNGDRVVKIDAQNASDLMSIDVPAILISNNTFSGKDLVPESITILELDSERSTLAPNNEIAIVNNSLEAGMKTFKFNVKDFENDSSANIPVGGNIPERQATVLLVSNMTTTAITRTADRNGEYFVFKLTDANGNILVNKTVQVGFNGNVYTRTTNENGTARVQVNLIAAAGYTFAVSFLGDDEYNASFAVAKITVNKQKGSLTAPAKSYKSTAKIKSLTTTFKDANGKVVSGKKVTFTVNGKTYSATTNSKGVATVKVSLSTKKTYSYTVKFAGDNTFAAISKTGKVTIK